MEFKLKKLTSLFVALLTALMVIMPLTTVKSEAVGEVDVQMSGGQLTIGGGGFEYEDSDSAWNAFILKYRGFIVGISGIGAVTMIAFFIFNFLKLGAVSTNPSERAKVLQGLIWSGIAAAGLGAVSIIVGFFYGALQE